MFSIEILNGIAREAKKKGYTITLDNKFKWRMRFVPRDQNKDTACLENEELHFLMKQASIFIDKLR